MCNFFQFCTPVHVKCLCSRSEPRRKTKPIIEKTTGLQRKAIGDKTKY